MRKIADIALYQLHIQLSVKTSLITLFFIPMLMSIFLGVVNGGPSSINGAVIGVIYHPDSADDLLFKYVDLLRQQGQMQVNGRARYIICDLTKPTEQPEICTLADFKANEDTVTFAKNRLNDNVFLALLVLPAGFSTDLRAGKAVNVEMTTRSNPTIAQMIRQDLDAASARLSGALLAARTVTDRFKGDSTFFNQVFQTADSVWAKDPIQIEQSYSTVTGTAVGTGFAHSAPGIGAMFVLYNAFLLPQLFVRERERGTLQRLRALPLSGGQILAGKLLGQYIVCVMTFVLMLLTGMLFGLTWKDLLSLIVMVLLYPLSVTALALASSVIMKTRQQVVGFAVLLLLTLAPLGGAMWPSGVMPGWMQTLGKIVSPIAWSQEAFSKMIFYGATLYDILPSVVALLIFTAAFFMIGLRRYRYEQ